MENGDDWFAIDKVHHLVFCFFVSLLFSLLATFSRYPFIRRRRIWFGSVVSFAAGAAKEFADELGYFNSGGASYKDGVADLVGILIAAVMLYFIDVRAFSSSKLKLYGTEREQAMELV